MMGTSYIYRVSQKVLQGGVNNTSTYGTSIQKVLKYCILSKERKSKEIILIHKKSKLYTNLSDDAQMP